MTIKSKMAKSRKTYWFEKFLWFISSENYLVGSACARGLSVYSCLYVRACEWVWLCILIHICVYVCVYVCMYVCLFVCVCVRTYSSLSLYLSLSLSVSVCLSQSLSLSLCLCLSLSVIGCACVYVYMWFVIFFKNMTHLSLTGGGG